MRKVYLQHNQKQMMYNTNKACLGKLMFGGQVSMIRVSLVQMIFPKSKTPMTNDVPVINFLELPWASEHVLYPFTQLGSLEAMLGWCWEIDSTIQPLTNHFITPGTSTPLKIDIEHEHHPFEKENHLPNHHFFGGSMLVFGCASLWK